MATTSFKSNRGKTLEEAFFYQMDRQLIELYSKSLKREEKLQSFANATGIRDQKRLESLVDSGFELSTLTALVWVPLVFVAWADGKLDESEKKSILAVLAGKNITRQTASMMIGHEWFRRSPSEELWKTWEDFITATMANLDPAVRDELSDEIIELCHVVAHASGGFLGLGRISPQENEVINRVAERLHQHAAACP